MRAYKCDRCGDPIAGAVHTVDISAHPIGGKWRLELDRECAGLVLRTLSDQSTENPELEGSLFTLSERLQGR